MRLPAPLVKDAIRIDYMVEEDEGGVNWEAGEQGSRGGVRLILVYKDRPVREDPAMVLPGLSFLSV